MIRQKVFILFRNDLSFKQTFDTFLLYINNQTRHKPFYIDFFILTPAGEILAGPPFA